MSIEPPEQRWLDFQIWRLAPAWWATVSHRNVTLRRVTADDENFFRRAYSDPRFKEFYSRGTPWRGNLAKALDKAGSRPPADQKNLHWVIRVDEKPVGLCCLSSLDLRNRRAELSIGFPGTVTSTSVTTSFLLAINCSLHILNLHKLYAHVYADNTRVISLLKRLGWNYEGFLVDHYHFPASGFVSTHVFCITKAILAKNPLLVRLAKKTIGVQWT